MTVPQRRCRPPRDHASVPVVPAALTVLTTLTVLLTGCAQVVNGTAAPVPLPATAAFTAPAVPGGPDRSGEIATAAAGMLQEFWTQRFPAAFGRGWNPIDSFTPVHSRDPREPAPPCLNRAADVARQAYYCPTGNAVAWDADELVPDLYARFGAAGVVVVLAHEVGHAVQTRLGVDDAQAREPQRYPTILLEAMADCYAGAALAHVVEQPVPGLPVGLTERDGALRALVGFSDPVGVDPADGSAHGNAFDRVSAFQDGYHDGPARCAAMSLDNRQFTQRRFGSQADRARGGDLPLPDLLPVVSDDARGWFGGLLRGGWRVPAVEPAGRCPGRAGVAQGPIAYCAATGAVTVDEAALARLHDDIGDYADVTLIASRYGLALLDAAGRPATGPAAGAAATCLAGAYTARLLDAPFGFRLSPGDLDEAVEVLLTTDWAARDAAGEPDPDDRGFERVGDFRAGMQDGAAACVPA